MKIREINKYCIMFYFYTTWYLHMYTTEITRARI